MKEFFDQAYQARVKRGLLLRLLLFFAAAAVLAALYIFSFFNPAKLWVTLAIGLASVLLLGAGYILFISPVTALRRMLREVGQGLCSEDTAVLQSIGEEAWHNGVACTRATFSAQDETGRETERPLLIPADASMEPGRRYRIRTYQQLVVACQLSEEETV